MGLQDPESREREMEFLNEFFRPFPQYQNRKGAEALQQCTASIYPLFFQFMYFTVALYSASSIHF